MAYLYSIEKGVKIMQKTLVDKQNDLRKAAVPIKELLIRRVRHVLEKLNDALIYFMLNLDKRRMEKKCRKKDERSPII